jgi:hypothetical protein
VADGPGADPFQDIRSALFLPVPYVFFSHFAERGIETAIATTFADEGIQEEPLF